MGRRPSGLRIVAGTLKGRRIPLPQGLTVRPTPERVREALFSILSDGIHGATVLDAFSGSGALGLEALSRGARQVVFVEQDSDATTRLTRVATQFGVSSACRIVRGDARRLSHCGLDDVGFDLVLADPPYNGELAQPFLNQFANGEGLTDAGRITIERSAKQPELRAPTGLVGSRTARYGDTCLDFFELADLVQGSVDSLSD